MKSAPLVCALMIAAYLAGCEAKQVPQQQANQTAEIEKQLAEIDKRLREVEIKSGASAIRIDWLDKKYSSGVFDPSESSFQRIDALTGYGSFAVSFQDVQPFGDGVRITLNLGNPWNVSFHDVKVSLTYGPREPDMDAPKWVEEHSKWEALLKKKEHKVTEEVRAGHWNPVRITLPEIKADQFGYLAVSLDTNNISLMR